jgi:hypothetical protein
MVMEKRLMFIKTEQLSELLKFPVKKTSSHELPLKSDLKTFVHNQIPLLFLLGVDSNCTADLARGVETPDERCRGNFGVARMKVGESFITDSEPFQKESLWSDLDRSGSGRGNASYGDLKNLHYAPYLMPDHSLTSYLCFVPASIYHSLSHMAKIFGWGFIFSVLLVYGFQQGLGNSWFFQVTIETQPSSLTPV